MKTSIKTLFAAGLLASSILSTAASAQEVSDPGHPRINEVDQRLATQQNRIDAGLADGQITKGEAIRDERRDERVEQQLTADEAKNGGHITKAEDRQLNRELNHDSRAISRQDHEIVPGHPRVSEIDQRLQNQEHREEAGLKDGQITKGQFIRDERRDERVEQQLSRDEAEHGGHITKGEQARMNRELNHNSRAIHHQRHS